MRCCSAAASTTHPSSRREKYRSSRRWPWSSNILQRNFSSKSSKPKSSQLEEREACRSSIILRPTFSGIDNSRQTISRSCRRGRTNRSSRRARATASATQTKSWIVQLPNSRKTRPRQAYTKWTVCISSWTNSCRIMCCKWKALLLRATRFFRIRTRLKRW